MGNLSLKLVTLARKRSISSRRSVMNSCVQTDKSVGIVAGRGKESEQALLALLPQNLKMEDLNG